MLHSYLPYPLVTPNSLSHIHLHHYTTKSTPHPTIFLISTLSTPCHHPNLTLTLHTQTLPHPSVPIPTSAFSFSPCLSAHFLHSLTYPVDSSAVWNAPWHPVGSPTILSTFSHPMGSSAISSVPWHPMGTAAVWNAPCQQWAYQPSQVHLGTPCVHYHIKWSRHPVDASAISSKLLHQWYISDIRFTQDAVVQHFHQMYPGTCGSINCVKCPWYSEGALATSSTS